MNATQFEVLLYQLRACSEAIKWAQGKDPQTFWDTCPRADWLLWLVGRMVDKEGWPTRKEVVLAACDCAETALKYVPQGEERPRKCIEIVREWVEGAASLDAMREAHRTVYAAVYAALYAAPTAADYAFAAAANAADAASLYTASLYAASPHPFAVYAALTAFDAASEAAHAAAYVVRAGVPQERLVEIVRKRIPIPFKEAK